VLSPYFENIFYFGIVSDTLLNFWRTNVCHQNRPNIKVGSSKYVHTPINEQSLCKVCKLVFSRHATLLKVRVRLSSTACCMSCPFQKLFYCAQCTAVNYLKLFNAQQANTAYAYENTRE